MDKNKDTYGQELLAFLKEEKCCEICERDDGYIDASGVTPALYFSDYKDWSDIQKIAVKKAKGKVLDVGGGAGRLALYLQKKNFEVVSIDNSPLAVRVCKERGVKNAKVLAIEDINYFKENSFDTVFMLGNNFGLFGSFKKAKSLLKKLYKITTPSALIVAETTDVYKTKEPVHIAYQKRNTKRGRMPGQVRIRIRFKQYKGDWFDYLLVSKDEMKDIINGTGWKVREFIDSKTGPQYIAVIEKKYIENEKI